MKDKNKLITVVETTEFTKQANKFMSAQSKQDFINFIAANPISGDLISGDLISGDLISGTGGVRKIRWANDPTKGKNGGSRVIYFYYNDDMPLFLFTAYSKAKTDNISQGDKNKLKIVVKKLVNIYRSNKNV